MLITLHKNARTTPPIRAEIAASSESTRALAKRFGVSELTLTALGSADAMKTPMACCEGCYPKEQT